MTEPQTNSGAIRPNYGGSEVEESFEVSAKIGAYLNRIQAAKNPN
jgi:hypothetical protein